MDLQAAQAGLQSQPPISGWALAQKTPCRPDYGCSAALPVPVVWSMAPLRLLLSLHSKPSFCSIYQLHQPISKLQDSPASGAGGEEAARLLLGIFPRSATVERGGKECKHTLPHPVILLKACSTRVLLYKRRRQSTWGWAFGATVHKGDIADGKWQGPPGAIKISPGKQLKLRKEKQGKGFPCSSPLLPSSQCSCTPNGSLPSAFIPGPARKDLETAPLPGRAFSLRPEALWPLPRKWSHCSGQTKPTSGCPGSHRQWQGRGSLQDGEERSRRWLQCQAALGCANGKKGSTHTFWASGEVHLQHTA